MTTYYAKTPGSILDANAWNTAANGSGTDATFADGNAAGHTLNLNALAMTSPNGTTLTCTLLTAASGTLTPTGTLTINGNVTYSGTATSGMLIYGTGATLTINGQVTNSSSGYALVGSGSGVLTISNVGGIAVSNSGAGRVVSHVSTGNLTATGSVTASTTGGIGVRIGAACAASITGDASASAGIGVRIAAAGSTLTINGNLLTSGTGVALDVFTGTAEWIGAATIAAGADCYITITGSGGNLALATAGGFLSLANSGTLVINKTSGTLTTTSGANTALIVLQTATSYAAIIGGTDANKAIITGPTLPAVGDVASGTVYGYAGTPLTGTQAAGAAQLFGVKAK